MHLRRYAIGVLLGILCASPAWAEPKVEEQVVGPAWEQGVTYTISPKGMHLATAGQKGSRFVVSIDGVDGEKFDQLFAAAGDAELTYADNGFVSSLAVKWQGPVAFSPDGSRFAYAARLGKDVVVILDGKEIFRGEYSQVVAPVTLLSFTPDGKHLFFYSQTPDTMQSFQLMIDGKPATPSFDQTPYPFFSPDGAHWGLVGGKPRQPDEKFLIIDGNDAGYVGQRPRFSPDSQHVVSTRVDEQNKQILLLDGKPIMSASMIDKFLFSPTGDIAAIATVGQKKQLFVNGKPVDGTENAWAVTFSPDGKHWAASCIASPSSWVVVDGKKQQDYASVHDVAFTPDSSKCIYIAEAGQKKFVVVNGEEGPGNVHLLIKPIFGTTGNHFAYCAGSGIGALSVYYDGKEISKNYRVERLTLSPDGEHYAYYAVQDAMSSALVVDGEVKGSSQSTGGEPMFFSPDSKHFAGVATPPKGKRSIYLDGQWVPSSGMLLGFTPDSRHLVAVTSGSDTGQIINGYSIDGQVVAKFGKRGVTWAGVIRDFYWEVQPDGSLQFFGMEPGAKYGPMKRIKVTPAAETSIATWLADTKAAEEKAIADAKVAADAKAAAATQAAADAAQKKADATAARQKAAADAAQKKVDAAAAKQKAKDDAAAAAAAKKAAAKKN